MALEIYAIDAYLPLKCPVHNPTNNAAAAAADSAPTYRIYEGVGGTPSTQAPILNGSLSALDTANITGCYIGEVQLTVANGFEPNKNYTLVITATVNAITGNDIRLFTIRGK